MDIRTKKYKGYYLIGGAIDNVVVGVDTGLKVDTLDILKYLVDYLVDTIVAFEISVTVWSLCVVVVLMPPFVFQLNKRGRSLENIIIPTL